jgi:hypothetical protein
MVLFWKKYDDSSDQSAITGYDRLKRFLKTGDELMSIVGPEDGSCVCGDWVGAVVSVSGTSGDWPPLLDALEDGVFHEGCKHRLEAYSEANHVEAEFCTEFAVAAMHERKKDISKSQSVDEVDSLFLRQQKFSKLYNAAQCADESGAYDSALSKCEAALEMLHKDGLFGADQIRIEQVLEARIRGMLSNRSEG